MVYPRFHADPNDLDDIVKTMHRALTPWFGCLWRKQNERGLAQYSKDSRHRWLKFLKA
jgi:hypothetical protein